MSKKTFTEEELERLRANPFTYAATPHLLSFTKDFKELFWNEYQKGALPRQILEQHGYPPDLLGKRRIWGIAYHIKQQYYSNAGLHEGSIKPPPSPRDGASEMKRLQGEVQFLRQEVEFLKKIFLARTTRK